jgi:hypothetical protein
VRAAIFSSNQQAHFSLSQRAVHVLGQTHEQGGHARAHCSLNAGAPPRSQVPGRAQVPDSRGEEQARGSARERERLPDRGLVAGARGTNGKFDSLLPRVQCVHSTSNCGRRKDSCALQCWPVSICCCGRRLCKMCTSRWLLCADTSLGVVYVCVGGGGYLAAPVQDQKAKIQKINSLRLQAADL